MLRYHNYITLLDFFYVTAITVDDRLHNITHSVEADSATGRITLCYTEINVASCSQPVIECSPVFNAVITLSLGVVT